MNLTYKPIEKQKIAQILPLLLALNKTTPKEILKKRIFEMVEYPNYECVGVYDRDKLIGISGLWYSIRHYIGKSVEPDHVIIDQAYRGKSVGKQFFNWIYQYTKQKGCDAVELNSYTKNRKSHKFYCNENFEIYAFHFVRILREDKKFY
ncbi:MAG: GNAT family N-acetyltransferase [Tenacibaculum sp.]